jgi:dihydrofolate synthase/folylpolyglutamate synthase
MSIEERYRKIEELLYTKHSQIKKNGVENFKKVLKKFSNPHKKIGKVIHITGTNGKGSVSYITMSLLKTLGYNVALYTSPHVNSLTERIQINGSYIPLKDFVEIFDSIYDEVKDLSFFEIMTLIAFLYFCDRVDYSVIEVGIGGMYDTTNVFEDTMLCFITSVSIDHTDILGSTIKDIAIQKAGIIKKNSLCVFPHSLNQQAKEIIIDKSACIGAKFLEVCEYFDIERFDDKNLRVSLRSKDNKYFFETNLLGTKQLLNFSMVVKAFEKLGYDITNDILKKSFAYIPLNCRFEMIRKTIDGHQNLFILDGAHNLEAFFGFIENLRFFKIKDPLLIFAILSTKKYTDIAELIVNSHIFKKVVITDIENPKKENSYVIANILQSKSKDIDVTVIDDLSFALRYSVKHYDNICVCGSFYLASDALKIIKTL